MEPTKTNAPKFKVSWGMQRMIDYLGYADICIDPNYASYDPKRAQEYYNKYLALHEEFHPQILHILTSLNTSIQACQPQQSNSEEDSLSPTQNSTFLREDSTSK